MKIAQTPNLFISHSHFSLREQSSANESTATEERPLILKMHSSSGAGHQNAAQQVIALVQREWRLMRWPLRAVVVLGAIFLLVLAFGGGGSSESVAVVAKPRGDAGDEAFAVGGSLPRGGGNSAADEASRLPVELHTKERLGVALHCPRFPVDFVPAAQSGPKIGRRTPKPVPRSRTGEQVVAETLAHAPSCRLVADPGAWHNRAVSVVRRFVKQHQSSSLFVDLGAHIGEVSLQLAPAFSRVVAIEAHRDNAAAIDASLRAGGSAAANVQLIEAAVGSLRSIPTTAAGGATGQRQETECVVVSFSPSDFTDKNLVCERNSPVFVAHSDDDDKVRLVTLDQALEHAPADHKVVGSAFEVKVVKLDLLPGAVMSALRSGAEALCLSPCADEKNTKPQLLFMHFQHGVRRGAVARETAALFAFMEQKGYSIVAAATPEAVASEAGPAPVQLLKSSEERNNFAAAPYGATVYFVQQVIAKEFVSLLTEEHDAAIAAAAARGKSNRLERDNSDALLVLGICGGCAAAYFVWLYVVDARMKAAMAKRPFMPDAENQQQQQQQQQQVPRSRLPPGQELVAPPPTF